MLKWAIELPLSLEKTRVIIDRCITQFLEKRLEDGPPTLFPDPSLVNGGRFSNESAREGILSAQVHDDGDSPLHLSPQQPTGKVRSPSESALPPVQPQRQNDKQFMSSRSADPFGHPVSRSARQKEDETAVFDSPDRAIATRPTAEPANHVFRTLEGYISSCFAGCAILNASFIPVKPPHEHKSRTESDPHPRRQVCEQTPMPTLEADVFLSELDPKTLLLGDVAENGSWWTGGRVPAVEKDGQNQQDRSPERWRGVVTAKSPRINWIELAEWYRIVINAGDVWERKWQEMRSRLSGPEEQLRWQAVSVEQLHRDMVESRLHLQRSLLKATENLLKRPRRPLTHPEDCRFLLMILANPLLSSSAPQNPTVFSGPLNPRLRPSEAHAERTRPSTATRVPSSGKRPGSLGHHSGIIKRALGLMANVSNDIHQFMVSWFARFSDGHFQRMVDMIGSFVTHRLSRQQRRPVHEPINPTDGLVPNFSDSGVRHPSQLHAALGARPASTSAKSSGGRPQLSSYSDDWQVRAAARVMALFFQANVGHTSRKRDPFGVSEDKWPMPSVHAKLPAHSCGQIIPISSFYNSMLDYADLVADFESWETTKTKFTFCQYPFFLSIYAKIHILEHDARRQMEVKAREAFFDSILSRKVVSQYLVLKVRRECLVEDSLRSVSEVIGAGAGDIKKGLRIDFVGEEGIDAGGLRKEWFLLLVREIFDPYHGLFVYDDDSQYCYFNPFCFESSEQFFLVGVLLGLAIYNSTILDVAFPPFVFKKMLASAPPTGDKLTSTPKISHNFTLDDLAQLRPALARGLRQLLEFDGDVQETFCRDFVVEMDRYGELVQVPLCPGGPKRPVTNSNRREFVDLYVHYLLDSAVVRQYEPFKRGFFTVCGGNALSLFRPEEIELLVRGSDEPLDIASLRAVAQYDGWPKSGGAAEQQPQVVWFWEFFERAMPAEQRKILSFITGSDRIPAMGATNLVIRIVLLRSQEAEQGREVERFPIARTCFNTLSLYPYSAREKLEAKLWTAVTESEGFGLK